MYILYLKRATDILLSLVVVVLMSWLFILILILYVVTLQFPVFYFQKRIGKNQKHFSLVKFRSLTNSNQSLHDRRFWLGDLLRFFSMDELPQIWNVLKGDMSFVGPRPLPVEYEKFFNSQEHMRHSVNPGITGLAQVNGRHDISWKEKFKYDLFYVNHQSFKLDLMILVKTIFLLLSFKRDKSLYEQPFNGN